MTRALEAVSETFEYPSHMGGLCFVDDKSFATARVDGAVSEGAPAGAEAALHLASQAAVCPFAEVVVQPASR